MSSNERRTGIARSPVSRRSNQLSYEATDVGNWSFVSSNERRTGIAMSRVQTPLKS